MGLSTHLKLKRLLKLLKARAQACQILFIIYEAEEKKEYMMGWSGKTENLFFIFSVWLRLISQPLCKMSEHCPLIETGQDSIRLRLWQTVDHSLDLAAWLWNPEAAFSYVYPPSLANSCWTLGFEHLWLNIFSTSALSLKGKISDLSRWLFTSV